MKNLKFNTGDIIVAVISVCLFCIAFLYSCEWNQDDACIENSQPMQQEAAQAKTLLLTTYKIVVLGEGFPKSGQATFITYKDSALKGLFSRPPLKQWAAASRISVTLGSYGNNFLCKTISNGELGATALVCDAQRVFKEANKTGVAYDLVIVLSYKNLYGSGLSGIAVIGTDMVVSSTTAHEVGHSGYNLPDSLPAGVMGSMVNHGGAVLNQTYIPVHQDKINNVMVTKLGPLNDSDSPTATITSPVNNFTSPVGSTIFFFGNVTDNLGVMRVEYLLDGVLMQSSPYWDNNAVANDATGARFYITPPAGTHSLIMRAVDAAYNTGSDTIQITVN